MLARTRKSADEKDQGFTLIELLVVMIIIGILAAIAIPTFLSQRNKGYDTQAISDLTTARTEIETFYTDGQAYPAAATDVLYGTGTATATQVLVKKSPSPLSLTYKNTSTATVDSYCIQVASKSGNTYHAISTAAAYAKGACPA